MDAQSSIEAKGPIDLARVSAFRVGTASVQPSRLVISGPSGEVSLEPRVMQVLAVLGEAHGATVSRDTLLDRCWPGVVVGEDSVHRAIAEARRALREAGAESGIETVPRVGYRLEVASKPDAAGQPPGAGPPLMARRGLVVGAAAIGALAVGGWWVMRPKRDPRVTTLLESARQALREELPDRNAQGLGFLKEAAALAPNDPEVLGLLSVAWRNASEYGAAGEASQAAEQSEATARKALAIDPDEGNALAALATLQPFYGDWAAAERRLLNVLDKAPDALPAISHLTTLYQSSGYLQASDDRNLSALRLDPLSPVFQFRGALKHWIGGRLPQADAQIDRAIELWPRHPAVWNTRLMIYAYTGRADAGLEYLESESQRPATVPPMAMALWRAVLGALASGDAAARDRARAASIKAAQQSVSGSNTALMYLAHSGELDTAFEVANGFLLRRGPYAASGQIGDRQTWVTDQAWRRTMFLFTPAMLNVRRDPRFASLAEGMGLTRFWRDRGEEPDYPAFDARQAKAAT